MDAEVENETTSESDDEKANKFPILPSGDGGDVKLNNNITSKPDVNKCVIKSKDNKGATGSSTKTSKWTKFSRLLKIGAPDATPDTAASDENMEKYKRHSLGKIFRQGISNMSRNTYCEEAKGGVELKNASGKSPEQTHPTRFLGSWLNSLQRGSHQTVSCQFAALAKEEAANSLPKDHGGSLGKFFRFKQGKKFNPSQKTSELSELSKTSSSEFVTLPLEPPLDEQYDESNEPLALKMGSGCPFFINNEEVN